MKYIYKIKIKWLNTFCTPLYIYQLYLPPRTPYVNINISRLGANDPRMKPVAAITLPAIVTTLQPNLLTRPLVIGPARYYLHVYNCGVILVRSEIMYVGVFDYTDDQ